MYVWSRVWLQLQCLHDVIIRATLDVINPSRTTIATLGAVNGVPCLLVPVGLRLAPPTATTITASTTTTTTTAASAAATALLKAAASPALLRAPTTGVAISTLHLVRSLAARVTRLTSSLSHHQQHLHWRQLSNTHTRLTALFQDYPGEPVPER